MSIEKIFAQLVQENQKASQQLDRRPEPEAVTNAPDSVAEYDRVLNTNMVGNYTSGLELLYRCRDESRRHRALDLSCGPGHFTIFLRKYLGYEEVTGVDLAPNMIEVAQRNAKHKNCGEQVQFSVGNVCDLSSYARDSRDLVSFTNSAHHLSSLDDVRGVLTEADRIAKPEGIILLTDVGRLKTKELTEQFIELAGAEFKALGMPHMFEDFYNSMYAAWTPDELRQAIPESEKRNWVHMVPTQLTNFQAIIGLPKGQDQVFVRPGRDWFSEELLTAPTAQQAWAIMKGLLETAQYQWIDDQVEPAAA